MLVRIFWKSGHVENVRNLINIYFHDEFIELITDCVKRKLRRIVPYSSIDEIQILDEEVNV